MSRYDLCNTARKNSRWVWGRLSKADNLNSRLGEEAITDFFVLNFRDWQPSGVRIKTFSKASEARNGSDWEWWFGGAGGWVGMRVQAKVIDLHTQKYTHIKYVTKSGVPQVDRLIKSALSNRLLPIYCLYTYWSQTLSARLKTIKPLEALKKAEYGVSILSAFEVQKSAKSSTSLVDYFARMQPLDRLFCTGYVQGSGFAESILRNALELNFAGQGEEMSTEGYLRNRPPWYVAELVETQARLSDFSNTDPELAGVLAIEVMNE